MNRLMPQIVMIVGESGVSVMTDNAEFLTKEELPGFEVLHGKVNRFAAELIEYVTKRQKANQGKAH